MLHLVYQGSYVATYSSISFLMKTIYSENLPILALYFQHFIIGPSYFGTHLIITWKIALYYDCALLQMKVGSYN